MIRSKMCTPTLGQRIASLPRIPLKLKPRQFADPVLRMQVGRLSEEVAGKLGSADRKVFTQHVVITALKKLAPHVHSCSDANLHVSARAALDMQLRSDPSAQGVLIDLLDDGEVVLSVDRQAVRVPVSIVEPAHVPVSYGCAQITLSHVPGDCMRKGIIGEVLKDAGYSGRVYEEFLGDLRRPDGTVDPCVAKMGVVVGIVPVMDDDQGLRQLRKSVWLAGGKRVKVAVRTAVEDHRRHNKFAAVERIVCAAEQGLEEGELPSGSGADATNPVQAASRSRRALKRLRRNARLAAKRADPAEEASASQPGEQRDVSSPSPSAPDACCLPFLPHKVACMKDNPLYNDAPTETETAPPCHAMCPASPMPDTSEPSPVPTMSESDPSPLSFTPECIPCPAPTVTTVSSSRTMRNKTSCTASKPVTRSSRIIQCTAPSSTPTTALRRSSRVSRTPARWFIVTHAPSRPHSSTKCIPPPAQPNPKPVKKSNTKLTHPSQGLPMKGAPGLQ